MCFIGKQIACIKFWTKKNVDLKVSIGIGNKTKLHIDFKFLNFLINLKYQRKKYI